ncbi:unnamed protein product [Prunus armeniaca]|uniref:Uncharacterized protein n=1 Tax=Prunus armeniaca TaxID=36596 RepID=A0A6J5TPX5_PRUAR|nr:unnamed protein product [Prunus armeniaca]
MSWDFRALGAPHPSYGFSGIVGEVVLQAKHVLVMSAFNKVKASAFNKAKVLGGRDRMSMTEIDNMVRELGYDELNDDQDVIDILVFVLETRLIDIFLYHGVDGNEEADIMPNKGVVIEELDDNYEAIVPVEELNEDPNGEQSGGGTEKPRESCARQGVSEKGKEKAVERESSAVQKDKEKVVERESSATVDKGKSKVSYVFGKRKARAFGKRRCKNVKKTRDKEDQRSNTVIKGVVEKEVVEGSVEKSKLSRCHPMKTRKARNRTTVCDDEKESADSLDSDFANPNFSCDDNDDDVDFHEWVDKQSEWVGDGAKGKEP